MESLPGELIDYLCSFLFTPSLKCFRRTCKTFAGIGESHLFHDFEFRLFPSRHHLYQLEQLAAHSSIAQKLSCLSYQSGVVLEYANYRYWQENVYKDISSAFSQGLASRGTANHQYEQFHAALQARFTSDMPVKYDLYRWHLDQEAAMMAERRVRNSIMRILNDLGSRNSHFRLKVVMAEPQISLEELEAFDPTQYACELPEDPDPRRRVMNRRRHCLTHFVNFLDATELSSCQITNLEFVDMPYQLLTVDSIHGADVLDAVFRGLQAVDIKISQFPLSDWLARGGLQEVYFGGRNLAARRLAKLLNLPSDMRTLKLEFPEGKEAEYSFDLFDRTNIDRFPRLWLPHLRDLSLCRFRCTWEDLKALLEAARNVRNLTLKHCRLETGSMLDLITFMPQMKLGSISVEGNWYVDEDAGEWHSHTLRDFTDCCAATDYEGPFVLNGVRAKIESYMLGAGDSPLPYWTQEGKEDQVWAMSGDTSWHYLPSRLRA